MAAVALECTALTRFVPEMCKDIEIVRVAAKDARNYGCGGSKGAEEKLISLGVPANIARRASGNA